LRDVKFIPWFVFKKRNQEIQITEIRKEQQMVIQHAKKIIGWDLLLQPEQC
jgi:hypothetical protein